MTNQEVPRSFEYYANIEPKEVEWLWYPYIPYGKLTLIQGDPGEGKSTFVLQLISILTNGGELPDGTTMSDCQIVIYQCAEDSKEDTIRPRLIMAGADCERVVFIPDQDEVLTLADARIERAIIDSKARLLVLDPIQAFLPQDVDMQSAAAMRGLMRNLAEIADRNSCAIILIGHMNKSTGGKKLYRGLGSIDIAAIARSILLISRDEDSPEIRYMVPIKSSLAPEGPAIGFSLTEEHGFQWIGTCDFPPAIVEEELSLSSKKERAKECLRLLLAEDDIPSVEILKQMKEMNISPRTVRTAQKELGVMAYRKENDWYWHIDKVRE